MKFQGLGIAPGDPSLDHGGSRHGFETRKMLSVEEWKASSP